MNLFHNEFYHWDKKYSQANYFFLEDKSQPQIHYRGILKMQSNGNTMNRNKL